MAKELVISDHARFELERRQIDESLVQEVARAPGQVVAASKGRLVYQNRYFDTAEGKEMVLRLVVEPRQDSLYIVTAYKTSRIEKYWQEAQP